MLPRVTGRSFVLLRQAAVCNSGGPAGEKARILSPIKMRQTNDFTGNFGQYSVHYITVLCLV